MQGRISIAILPTVLAALSIALPDRLQAAEPATDAPGAIPDAPLMVPQAPAASFPAMRWTVSVEAISLAKTNGGASKTLVSRIPGDRSFGETAILAGEDAFGSDQFRQGVGSGPKVTLTSDASASAGLAFGYFSVRHLDDSHAVGPESSLHWYVMKAPGAFPAFWQTQDFAYQGMTWSAASSIASAEASGWWRVGERVVVLAGMRWMRLADQLVGSLTPSDRNVPEWKTPAAPCGADPSLQEINACPGAAGAPVQGYPPFWTTSTSNQLWGVQAGVAGTFAEHGDLQLAGALKAGLYANRATQLTGVSMEKQVYPAGSAATRAAVAGEAAIRLRYRLGAGLAVRLGYEVLWLGRVALAPGQIDRTYAGQDPTSETASGVNTGSSALFQGATFGVDYAF